MYHVKLLLKYTVKEQIFYEESILQVDADSFDAAYQKAENYVSRMIEPQRKKYVWRHSTLLYRGLSGLLSI